jgi:hypothetical protein
MYLAGVYEATGPNGGQTSHRETLLIGEWRKHWYLHEFLVTQFAGGMDEYKKDHFLSVKLSAAQLRKAIAAVETGEIKPQPGEEPGRDLALFQTALAWLEAPEEEEKRAVYYEAND